jgi:Domain of unknown function (DUF4190)
MKSHKIYLVTMLLFIVAILSNCTVQKRSYLNGYYVSWNKKAVPVLKLVKQVEENRKEVLKNETPKTIAINATDTPKLFFASVKNNVNSGLKRLNVKPLRLSEDSCGDVITLLDGSDIKVKVIEISSKFIKYKHCDNLSEPLRVVNADNVFMIKYANGNKEIIKRADLEVQPNKKGSSAPANIVPIVEKKYNDMAVVSIATFILYFTIILAPLPFIFGLIALSQFKKDPDKYKGKWMAILGITPGIIALCILLLAMLTFLI